MTIVLHLIEAPHHDLLIHNDRVRLLRHPFADAIADDGLDSVLSAIDGLDPTDRLVVVHPAIDTASVERLAALLRRSQRRRATIMISHGLGPLGADLLVERLMGLLTLPSVGLDGAAAWCRQAEAMITDVVWTMRAQSRWGHLDLRDRMRAWLPGHLVRSHLGPERHAAVATSSQMLAGLKITGTDVVVGGRNPRIIAQTVKQLEFLNARSVRVVHTTTELSVVAEVVVSSPTNRDLARSGVRPESSSLIAGRCATTTPLGSGFPRQAPRRRG